MHPTLLMTMPQPSVAVKGGLYGLSVTVGVAKLDGETDRLAGHVSAGGATALLPTMKAHDDLMPAVSVAVHVTVKLPRPKVYPVVRMASYAPQLMPATP